MLKWIAKGSWPESAVRVEIVASTRRIEPAIEERIEQAWQRALAKPGVHLFDGSVARFEGLAFDSSRVSVRLSRSSYRIVVGTNFDNAQLADEFGPDVMANPFGVSAGLISADGFLVLGVRSNRVAYYPGRVHPFAGSLEIRDQINLFDDARRELREEISLSSDSIESIRLAAIVEDLHMRHPESIFLVRTTMTADELKSQLDVEEHGELCVTRIRRSELESLSLDQRLTPFALAVVMCVIDELRA